MKIEETVESVTLDRTGQISEHCTGKATIYRYGLGADAVLDLVALPGLPFQMGSHDAATPEESPRHLVSLAPFQIGRGLVSQAQWQAVLGKLPSVRFRGAQNPVENITWGQAMEFCRKLSRMTGQAFHLPGEAQWEYACRAGTITAFHTGDCITTDQANYCGEHTYLDGPRGLYRHKSTPAGTFLPNGFGLYDMHGNLWEYCADLWHPDYTNAPFNGQAWVSGGEIGYRVCRGGSWHEPPANCRSATRLRVAENDHDDFYGFRVVVQ